MEFSLWETTSLREYLVSVVGLNISTRCLAISARRKRQISSSVFPENIEPEITSIHPLLRPLFKLLSINIDQK
jgi:hypothetical protein